MHLHYHAKDTSYENFMYTWIGPTQIIKIRDNEGCITYHQGEVSPVNNNQTSCGLFPNQARRFMISSELDHPTD